jgi:subtilisin family serine protease
MLRRPMNMHRISKRIPTHVIALVLVAVVAVPVAEAQIFPSAPPGPISLSDPARPVKGASDIYIVQLRAESAASYKGGTTGFAATKPALGERLNSEAAAVQSYVKHLESTHASILNFVDAPTAKIYSFTYALNGFAARLDSDQLTRLAHHPDVRRVWPDTEQQLQTNNSSLFLGLLDQQGGLRADLKLTGENVVIGIIDSGVAPNHPSLRDFEERVPRTCAGDWALGSWLGRWLCRPFRKNPPTEQVYTAPAGFHGICQEGDGFSVANCNNKLVGARYFVDGFLFRNSLDPGEFVSPKDADGHGTHLATIAAGNATTATLFGTRIAAISGIAPRARIAVYKACWLKPGESRATCATSDLARAIDAAVADGVDIINYSVGSLETDLTAPDDIALLNALDAGILSVVAAGNDGPETFTIGSPSSAPWVLTVGASTQTGTRFEEAIEILQPTDLSGQISMREAGFARSLADSGTVEATLVLTDDGQSALGGGGLGSIHDACEALINGSALAGAVAMIERGGCEFQIKLERAEAAGAVAVVVYNTTGPPIVMNGAAGSIAIPGVMIGAADADRLLDAFDAGDAVSVKLERGLVAQLRDTGNQMADFSSRGPALSESDFVKPDVTAPGVNILGGASPDIPNGTRGEVFQYLSGTSMAAPMVAGIAALLIERHPDWTPGMLKSALMSTTYTDIVTEDGEFLANPFDMGAGHVDANFAVTPGLVYETAFADHTAYLCGLDDPLPSAADCNALIAQSYPTAPEQLNLPSIGITEMIPGDEINRRVTNVGPASTYTATISAPPRISAVVQPTQVALATGESADFSITFDNVSAPLEFWQFGNINWSDGTRFVDTPMAVQPVYLRAPEKLRLSSTSGSNTLPVDFGYSGGYTVGVHGLHGPGLQESSSVPDDPTNNFSFRFDNGVSAHFFTLSPDEILLRVALFDELTDGNDALDLYLFYCSTLTSCTQVGQSGSFTSDEEIDLVQPQGGLYAILVHGFQTDDVVGGSGAEYELFAWSFGSNDDQNNLRITAPGTVATGDRLNFSYDWGPLDPNVRYVGAISHDTPFDLFFLTIVTENLP